MWGAHWLVIVVAKLQGKPSSGTYRYPLEEHFVTTSDGYVLKMERMPRRSAPPTRECTESTTLVCNLDTAALAGQHCFPCRHGCLGRVKLDVVLP